MRRPRQELAASHRTALRELGAIDHQRDQCCPDRNGEQRDQVPADRDPPPQTAASEATPARPDNAAVTRKAARLAPSDMPTPCIGRPSGKISESTIGGIAAVAKPIRG